MRVEENYTRYRVLARDREPLIAFMIEGLERSGCHVIHRPPPTEAPFRITFATPEGERIGVIAYAFHANSEPTKNRPSDEHRFQIKYGGDLSGLHRVWQDPYGLYVTLFLGINPVESFFVAADPILHDPTRFSVSLEFKAEEARLIKAHGWHAWERERRGGIPDAHAKRTKRERDVGGLPLFEALVGGTNDHFLRLVRFEREALGEAAGERHYLAERISDAPLVTGPLKETSAPSISVDRLHALAREFDLPEARVLDLIAERRMLKVAVRGSVAEEHLVIALREIAGVSHCRRRSEESGPDVELLYRGHPLTVECKNSSRVRTAEGYEKIDFQRTRAAKSDPCSRYYKPSEFNLVAACIHAVTEKWQFKYAPTRVLDAHGSCPGRLSSNVRLDPRWTEDAAEALHQAIQ